MKNQIVPLLAAALAAFPGALQAQSEAHYVPGIEGIKCATLPPPGFYFRDYNVLYLGETLNNGAGHNFAPAGFQAMVFATVPRAIYISDFKVLGGNLGGDIVLPFVSDSFRHVPLPTGGLATVHTDGVGDFYGESTLSWHPGQFDIGFAAGFWAPTGNSAGLPETQPGLGFWTPELTLGATWYPDQEKTWAISALNRYEFNSEYRNTGVTPGQAWTLEWGISKSVLKTLELGVVGYYQQRITASTGNEPLAEMLFPYSRVAAVGPEVNLFIPSVKLFVALRYNYEFMADNRAQGHTLALVLTKVF
jgi:hypothetical protein